MQQLMPGKRAGKLVIIDLTCSQTMSSQVRMLLGTCAFDLPEG
jgi:hypothetical protein